MRKQKIGLVVKRVLKYGLICSIIFIILAPILFFMGAFPVPYDIKSDKSTDDLSYLLEDDDLSEKNPQVVPGQSIPTSDGNYYLDKSIAILGVTVGQMDDGKEKELAQSIYPDYQTAWTALKTQDLKIIPSIEMINVKLKQFNDGTLAAIEMALQAGLKEIWLGKSAFLKTVVKELEEEAYQEARIFIVTGLSLGNDSYPIPQDINSEVEANKKYFLDLKYQSKPLGFYTWNQALEGIFKQDRYFQLGLFAEDSSSPESRTRDEQIIFQLGTILKDTQLRETYRTLLCVQNNITNPPYLLPLEVMIDYIPANIQDLREAIDNFTLNADENYPRLIAPETLIPYPQSVVEDPYRVFSLFPPAYAKETEIVQKMVKMGILGNYMNEFIKALWKGDIEITPDNNSGWYDYQLWALESLLNPSVAEENDRVYLTKEYKERLINAFKTIMTKNRETHIKFIGGLVLLSAKPQPQEIEIHVEPQITLLLRQIQGYIFLYTNLVNLLSEEFLQNIYRYTERGDSEISVNEELLELIDLLGGCTLLSGDDLGHPVDLAATGLAGKNETLLKEKALEWIDDIQEDPDLHVNVQMAIPIGPARGNSAYYWGILGVRPIKLKFWYEVPPNIAETSFSSEDIIIWLDTEYWILVDEFIEFESATGPWTRQEFQNLLTGVSTREEAEIRLQIREKPFNINEALLVLILLILGIGGLSGLIFVKKRKISVS